MKDNINNDRCLQTTFMMAAKSFVGMVRDNNEDSLQCSSDLDNPTMQWKSNDPCALSNRGALLVVADGMGGMNAGEVASEIAVETVKDCFRPENITSDVLRTRYTIERFMNNVITEADNRIKETSKQRPETKGMGTTMVMGWINGEKLYVSWCGDSRAYVFNPSKGLKRLSKDHSLVQELVDSGKISKEDAFDYPDSNVITNCLSAVAQKAEPSVLGMPHKLEQDDIILLCSDGLCGLIRDSEIQSVIAQNQNDMAVCCDALIKAACDAGGHDNVTVALCKMLTVKDSENEPESENNGRKTWINFGVGAVLALLIGLAVWYFWPSKPSDETAEYNTQTTDSTQTNDSSQTNCSQNIRETTQQLEVKTNKPKYVFKADFTDSVTAKLKANKNYVDLVIIAVFPKSNQQTKFVFEKFDTDNLIDCNYKNKVSKYEYKIFFDTKPFNDDTITGKMIETKNGDTISFNGVPITERPIMQNENGGKEGKSGLRPERQKGSGAETDTSSEESSENGEITRGSVLEIF